MNTTAAVFSPFYLVTDCVVLLSVYLSDPCRFSYVIVHNFASSHCIFYSIQFYLWSNWQALFCFSLSMQKNRDGWWL
ncbi:hypothetical protein AHF37_06897 [Paragonimus kellicotti]|nr:hypothetical protein AHF37_06897 [Paragonimus kellicotti]